jgi:small subunit ribosomal protein S20
MRNRANVSRYKTAVKKLEAAIEQKDAETARALLPGVVAAVDRAVSKSALSKNAASRKKSALTLRVNALG